MTARVLFEVALRILGLWILYTAITAMTSMTSWYFAIEPTGAIDVTTYLVLTGFFVAVHLALGVTLIGWALGIAARFYPPDSLLSDATNSEPQRRVGPGDIYHTACFVLGVCLLVPGIQSASEFATGAVSIGWQTNQLAHLAVSAVVYTTSGLLLIFGSRRIANLMSSLQYDPDSIPRQQFSIKMLLIITVAVAVILGVIRMITVGGR